MSADAARRHLDQLDALQSGATPGQWYIPEDRPVVMFSDTTSHPGIGSTYMRADAALIVAAVNALPALTAAVRAVLDLADELDATALVRDQESRLVYPARDRRWRHATADELRAAILSALTPSGPA